MKLLTFLTLLFGAPFGLSQQTCEAGSRLFNNDILVGEPVCIPDAPERVVSILNPSNLYPFGLKPLTGYSLERDSANFPALAPWIEEGIGEISEDEPNLELLLELHPDLMFFANQKVEPFVSQLEEIAPTVMYDENTDWRDLALFIGDVLNRSDKAAAELETLDARIAELTEAVKAQEGEVSAQTAAFIRIMDDGRYRLGSNWFASYICTEILASIGYQMPEVVQNVEGEQIEFGQEGIAQANSDVLFLVGSVGGNVDQTLEGSTMVQEVLNDPLWQTLDAVNTERVYEVPDYWLSTTSVTAAHYIVDDMAKIFGVTLATPNSLLASQ